MSNKQFYWGLTVMVIMFLAFFFLEMNRKTEKINIPVKEDTSAQYIYNRTILNWNNVRYWIKVFKIQHREIVCAQIIQECGWNLDSKRAIQNGNILGLKKAYNRLTTADYIRDGHSGYSSFIRCLKDYQLFQEANYKAGSYYEFLEKIHYAEDSTYTQKLRSIVRKIECRCKNSE